MWKQLQSSLPAQETSTQGTSLAHAASVLPRVPSPNKNQSAESTGTKIDVQALFNQAYNSAETQKPAKEESEVNTKKSKPVSRVVSNDEFAAMFKSLEEVHIAEEENREKEKEEVIGFGLTCVLCLVFTLSIICFWKLRYCDPHGICLVISGVQKV